MPGRSHLALFGRTSGLSAKVEGMSHGLPVTRDSLRYVTLDNLYEGQTLLEYQVSLAKRFSGLGKQRLVFSKECTRKCLKYVKKSGA